MVLVLSWLRSGYAVIDQSGSGELNYRKLREILIQDTSRVLGVSITNDLFLKRNLSDTVVKS